MVKIVQTGDPVLRQKAQMVPIAEIGSDKINKIIADMNTALEAEDDGAAIAAPQIGVPLRIFIISHKILPQRQGMKPTNQVFINPVIKKLSAKKAKMEEGCLSVRWMYGETKRAEQATVEAYNEKGHKFVRQGKGVLAQAFQHETDHLEGILFTDRAGKLEEIKPE